MARFLSDAHLWDELRKQSRATKSLVIVTAFLGSRPDTLLRLPKGALVIADLTEENVRRGSCSARGALRLLRRGVTVLQARALHAKIYLFDSKAIVSSANLSADSAERLTEAGVLLSGTEVAAVRAEVARIRRTSVALNEPILRKWAKLEPKRTRLTTAAKSRPSLGCPLPEAGRVWLINAWNHVEPPEERKAKKRKARDLSGTHSVDASRIAWFSDCGRGLFRRVHDSDWLVLWSQPGEGTRSKIGKIEGPYECLGAVDLGRSFGDGRYALPIVPRRLRAVVLTQKNVVALRKALSTRQIRRNDRLVRPRTIRVLRRMLR